MMKPNKRWLWFLWAWVVAGHVGAQPFPSKPIRIGIGFQPGGPLDQHARLLSDRLQAQLAQPIVIDYKAGADGIVGAQERERRCNPWLFGFIPM